MQSALLSWLARKESISVRYVQSLHVPLRSVLYHVVRIMVPCWGISQRRTQIGLYLRDQGYRSSLWRTCEAARSYMFRDNRSSVLDGCCTTVHDIIHRWQDCGVIWCLSVGSSLRLALKYIWTFCDTATLGSSWLSPAIHYICLIKPRLSRLILMILKRWREAEQTKSVLSPRWCVKLPVILCTWYPWIHVG